MLKSLLNTKVIGNIEVSHIITTAFLLFVGYLMFGENGAFYGMMKALHIGF